MRILIDTQCWLWLNAHTDRFSRATLRRLESPQTDLLLSAASVWEMAIKHALGKLRLPDRLGDYVSSRMRLTRTRELPVTIGHAAHVGTLPLHHRDPFDRILVAQAQVEHLLLLSADAAFKDYDVDVIEP